ncbi:MAG: DUF4178 domain-containing protein [Nannocystaceae bacterium]|nr:DUF4178 domain-containing protein [Nannocystaceae bacterium]
MTIAGAFWVGVLAARRLRDWGEGRRAIEDGHAPLMLATGNGTAPDDARTRRIRALVADRLRQDRGRPVTAPMARVQAGPEAEPVDLELATLRQGDVVAIDCGDPEIDGDYIVDGMVLLREGGQTTVVAVMQDAGRRAWLVGPPGSPDWYLVQPRTGHGLSGEPPRNITRDRGSFSLQRRGQASAACTGLHDRPELPRVATYLYTGGGRDVLWLERWDHEVLLGEGKAIDATAVSFLPGS